MISNGGTVIKMAVTDVKRLGRSTQGVIVMRLRDVEQVSSIALVMDAGDDPPAPPAGTRVTGDDGEQIEAGLYDEPGELDADDAALEEDEELDDADDGDDEPESDDDE
jgi:hypothetical protein